MKLCVFDPLQAFLGANVDMNRANEVRPILARLGKVAERTGCAIVFIGHLNKAAGMQSLQRGLGSIDIVAAMRSVLVIGKLKKDPSIRVMAHEKSSLAPNGSSIAFKLDEEDGFVWIGEYEVTADDLLSGTETKRENKTDAASAHPQAARRWKAAALQRDRQDCSGEGHPIPNGARREEGDGQRADRLV